MLGARIHTAAALRTALGPLRGPSAHTATAPRQLLHAPPGLACIEPPRSARAPASSQVRPASYAPAGWSRAMSPPAVPVRGAAGVAGRRMLPSSLAGLAVVKARAPVTRPPSAAVEFLRSQLGFSDEEARPPAPHPRPCPPRTLSSPPQVQRLTAQRLYRTRVSQESSRPQLHSDEPLSLDAVAHVTGALRDEGFGAEEIRRLVLQMPGVLLRTREEIAAAVEAASAAHAGDRAAARQFLLDHPRLLSRGEGGLRRAFANVAFLQQELRLGAGVMRRLVRLNVLSLARETLEERVAVLEAAGLQRSTDLSDLLARAPGVLLVPAQRLSDRIAFFRRLEGLSTPAATRAYFLRHPGTLAGRGGAGAGGEADADVGEKMQLLRSLGLSQRDLAALLRAAPHSLSAPYERLAHTVDYLATEGFEREQLLAVVRQNPGLLARGADSLRATVQFLRRVGRSRHEAPRLPLRSSAAAQVANTPWALTCSLHARIMPRLLFARSRRPEAFFGLSLLTLLSVSDERFATMCRAPLAAWHDFQAPFAAGLAPGEAAPASAPALAPSPAAATLDDLAASLAMGGDAEAEDAGRWDAAPGEGAPARAALSSLGMSPEEASPVDAALEASPLLRFMPQRHLQERLEAWGEEGLGPAHVRELARRSPRAITVPPEVVHAKALELRRFGFSPDELLRYPAFLFVSADKTRPRLEFHGRAVKEGRLERPLALSSVVSTHGPRFAAMCRASPEQWAAFRRRRSRLTRESATAAAARGFLGSVGVSPAAVEALLAREPIVAELSVENLASKVRELEGTGLSGAALSSVLVRSPQILKYSVRTLRRQLAMLRAWLEQRRPGTPLAEGVARYPLSLALNLGPASLVAREKLHLLASLGIRPGDLAGLVRRAPSVLRASTANLATKIDALSGLGFRGNALRDIVLRFPAVLTLASHSLQERLDVLAEAGVPHEGVVKSPKLLRLSPRFVCARALFLRMHRPGPYPPPGLAAASFLSSTDEKFARQAGAAPDAWRAFRARVAGSPVGPLREALAGAAPLAFVDDALAALEARGSRGDPEAAAARAQLRRRGVGDADLALLASRYPPAQSLPHAALAERVEALVSAGFDEAGVCTREALARAPEIAGLRPRELQARRAFEVSEAPVVLTKWPAGAQERAALLRQATGASPWELARAAPALRLDPADALARLLLVVHRWGDGFPPAAAALAALGAPHDAFAECFGEADRWRAFCGRAVRGAGGAAGLAAALEALREGRPWAPAPRRLSALRVAGLTRPEAEAALSALSHPPAPREIALRVGPGRDVRGGHGRGGGAGALLAAPRLLSFRPGTLLARLGALRAAGCGAPPSPRPRGSSSSTPRRRRLGPSSSRSAGRPRGGRALPLEEALARLQRALGGRRLAAVAAAGGEGEAGGRGARAAALSAARPEVAAELDAELNGGLGADAVAAASHRKLWWRCRGRTAATRGRRAWRTARGRAGRRAAPPAGGARRGAGAAPARPLASERPEVAAELAPDLNGGLSADAVAFRSKRKLWWRCPASPAATPGRPASPTARARGAPRLPRWDAARNGAEAGGVYPSSEAKAWWRCGELGCGHAWEATPRARTRPARPSGCPECARRAPSASAAPTPTSPSQ
eukprot:tig00020996_g16943.t1